MIALITEREVDIAVLMIVGLVILTFFGKKIAYLIMFSIELALELYFIAKTIYLIHLSHIGIETTAVLVACDMETRQEKDSPEYNVYAPIMRYKTEQGQIIQARYRVFTEDFDYERNFDYPICYVPSKPELFYFTEYPSEFSSDAKKNLLRYSAGFMMSIIYMFLTV